MRKGTRTKTDDTDFVLGVLNNMAETIRGMCAGDYSNVCELAGNCSGTKFYFHFERNCSGDNEACIRKGGEDDWMLDLDDEYCDLVMEDVEEARRNGWND